jgi:AraC-like DNA-binding protein
VSDAGCILHPWEMKRAIPPEPTLVSQLKTLGAVVTPALELFDQLPDTLFWIKDPRFRFCWANRALVLLNGRKSRWDLIGRTDTDFSEVSRANQFYHDDAKALAGEPVVNRIELVVFNHVGRWYSTTKLPLRNRRGRIVGTVGIAVPVQGREGESSDDTQLAAAMQYIGQHCREQLTNRKIAQACGLSLRVFYRQFLEAYHCSPHAYLRQLRVRLSCQPLVFSGRPLAAIAEEFGFADQSHYTKAFRQTMGMTPSDYRDRYGR